jgi:hypothetical protein
MTEIKKICIVNLAISVFLLASLGSALPDGSPAVVNVMIDANVQHAPTPEQSEMMGSSLLNLSNEMVSRGLNTTIYVTNDTVSARRLAITYQGTLPGVELALHGMGVDDKLSKMSDEEQGKLLNKSYEMLYSCYVCGGQHIDIKGFLPQTFDQNEDTFKNLQNLGIVYDAGFQVGNIYRPGHEFDAWPYPIDGFNLTAVPISTYLLNGERVYFSDRYMRDEKKLSGSQWYDLLVKKFDESAKSGDPMVVIFSTAVSGNGDYLDAYKKFVEFANAKGSRFVSTLQLVEMAAANQLDGQKNGKASGKNTFQPMNASHETGVLGSCPTCSGSNSKGANSIINVTVIKKQKCLTCGQNSSNLTDSASI